MALQFRATPLRRLIARERLVAEYWYLCRRAARRFMRRGLDRADLEQVGAIGLIKAVDRYDPSQTRSVRGLRMASGRRRADASRSRQRARSARAARRARSRAPLVRRGARAVERARARAVARATSRGASARRRSRSREIRAYRASSRVLSFEPARATAADGPAFGIDDVLDRLTRREHLCGASPPLERQIVRSIDLDGLPVVELATRLGLLAPARDAVASRRRRSSRRGSVK